jgi:hypothetical protein
MGLVIEVKPVQSQFTYSFGGLKIRSSIALPGLRSWCGNQSDGVPIIRLSLQSCSTSDQEREIFRWKGRYGLILSSLGPDWLFKSARDGLFYITDRGHSISCSPDPRSTIAGVAEIIVRRILPRVVQLHGRIASHAATLTSENGGYLLLGPSGTGKSTLAAALAGELGWNVLSDDISILDVNSDPPHVNPATIGVCVWQDSLSALAASQASSQKLLAYQTKFWHDISEEQPPPRRPIRAFLLLPRRNGARAAGEQVEAVRVPPAEALVHLVRHLIRFNPTDMTAEARIFKSLGKLAHTVPMYALFYPRSYEELGRVAQSVGEFCRKMNTDKSDDRK